MLLADWQCLREAELDGRILAVAERVQARAVCHRGLVDHQRVVQFELAGRGRVERREMHFGGGFDDPRAEVEPRVDLVVLDVQQRLASQALGTRRSRGNECRQQCANGRADRHDARNPKR